MQNLSCDASDIIRAIIESNLEYDEYTHEIVEATSERIVINTIPLLEDENVQCHWVRITLEVIPQNASDGEKICETMM